MDRDSTPPALERSGSKGVSSAAKRQNTINRYFQAAVESCSQGSDSIAREDKEPTETINLISQRCQEAGNACEPMEIRATIG